MGKTKKKGRHKLSEDVRVLLDGAVNDLMSGLDDEDAAGRLAKASAGIKDREADVVTELGRHRRIEVLTFLYRLREQAEDKAVVKAARQAIYRLEQAGVVPDEAVKPARSSMIKPVEERGPVAFLGPYDIDQTRIGFLGVPSPAGGYETALFAVNHRDGFVEFSAWNGSGAKLRQLPKDLQAEEGQQLVEVDPKAAKYVLTEAARVTRSTGRPVPEGFDEFNLLSRRIAAGERPGLYEVVDADDVDEVKKMPKPAAEALMADPFMENITLTHELEPYISKIENIYNSVLVLTEQQREEQKADIERAAQIEIYTAEKKEQLKLVLEETGLLFHYRGDRSLAAAAAGLAMMLEEDEGSLDVHPVIQAVVERSFVRFWGMMARHEEEPEEDEMYTIDPGSNLIVPRERG